MLKLEVFDSPMCCTTGICGSSLDSTLVTFASDLEWLKAQGVEVVRYGLSFEPAKFVENEEVKKAICKSGNSCLPIIVVANEIVSKASYPSRGELASMCDVEYNSYDAPAVHREANCCCGIDCDCGIAKIPEGACDIPECDIKECDCSNAAAEDNCSCGVECNCHTLNSTNKSNWIDKILDWFKK